MIAFDLICATGHRFEGWFRSGVAYDTQARAGHLECPVCGSHEVKKAPMAPHIGRRSRTEDDRAEASAEELPLPAQAPAALAPDLPAELRQEMARVVAKIRDHVERNCDYVGDRFSEEARAIYYGEAEPRGIYGEASAEDAEDLLDEGIDILALPILRKEDG